MKCKTVLITGASRGIGKAIASMCIDNNYNTILICKNDIHRMDSLVNNAISKGLICLPYSCDVSSYDEVCTLFQKEAVAGLNIDFLINNAGISYVGLLQDMTSAEWHNTIETNLSSVFYFCRCVIPKMLKQGNGKIINISSVWGGCGASCEVAYSASKGGVNAFTKALAKELAPSNIQVNALACGAIDTDMNSHLTESDKADLENEIPAGRFGTPEEVAELVHGIMTSPGYMTGQIITADGGWN